jgi:hypothetical protein
MSDREPTQTTNLDTLYGTETMPWSLPRELLSVGSFGPATACFLGTVQPEGRPHAAGVGGAWYDGDVYVQAGPNTRKARNIAANPACTVSASFPGMDLVFEGEARRVTDAPTRRRSRRSPPSTATAAGPSRSTATR